MNDARARRRRRRRRLAAAVLLATTTGPGCYQYRPVTDARLPVGASVRVTLTPTGQERLASTVGGGVDAVEGDVVAAADDGTLTVRVVRLLTVARVPMSWSGAAVAIPVEGAASVERRELSRRRTALLVGGVVLGAAVLGLVIGSAASDAGGGPNPGPIQP